MAVGGKVPYDLVKSKLGADQQSWDIFRQTVAKIESGGKYDIAGGSGGHYDGRYQLGADAKTDGARQAGIPNPGHTPAARQAFRKNPDLQERLFAGYTIANHAYLSRNKQYASKTLHQKLQILGYAHNQGMGGAENWMKTGKVGSDGFGTKGTKYTDAIAAAFRSGKVPDVPGETPTQNPNSTVASGGGAGGGGSESSGTGAEYLMANAASFTADLGKLFSIMTGANLTPSSPSSTGKDLKPLTEDFNKYYNSTQSSTVAMFSQPPVIVNTGAVNNTFLTESTDLLASSNVSGFNLQQRL